MRFAGLRYIPEARSLSALADGAIHGSNAQTIADRCFLVQKARCELRVYPETGSLGSIEGMAKKKKTAVPIVAYKKVATKRTKIAKGKVANLTLKAPVSRRAPKKRACHFGAKCTNPECTFAHDK